MSWRDILPVHPAAELFPLMSEPELKELAADIKKNRQRCRVILWRENEDGPVYLLDGRNRLDGRALVGLPVLTERGLPSFFDFRQGDPYALVLSLNLYRRHLTSEQKRELIANVLKAKPAASNRKIAKQVKADDKTVASVRRELESGAEIPQLEKTTGTDGKQYKAKKRNKPTPDSSLDKLFDTAAPGSVTAETVVDKVDERVTCVINTIMRHVKGLSLSETERFFTTLRARIDADREALRELSGIKARLADETAMTASN